MASLAAPNATDSAAYWAQYWDEYCPVNPMDPQCADKPSFYNYRLSLPANVIFLVIFVSSLVAFGAVFGATRRGLGFTVAMLFGLLCEILGYAGRIMSYQNQWTQPGFLTQICTLTIGPAFLTAGIYLCLKRIVCIYGAHISRFDPAWYPKIFIPCDFVSLVLQATGGGMASVASNTGASVDTGDNIMLAGLVFQVVTTFVFILMSGDFALRLLRHYRRHGESGLEQDERARSTRARRLFRLFLVALAVSTICIFWRCVFRVAELCRGWNGPLTYRQDLFIGFEGVMISVAVLGLNVFHPSIAMGQLMQGMVRTERPSQRKTEPGMESDRSYQ